MQHDHEFWHYLMPKKKLTQLYISLALRSFALSFVGLFIPLYLYKEMGYSFETTLLFFVFYALIFAISTPLAAKLCAKYGIKHCILFSIPLYLSFIILLHLLPVFQTPLIIISALFGASQGLYWMGTNLLFAKISHRKHRGEEVGKRMAFKIAGTIAGPLIGGFLITYFGFTIVFIIVSLTLLTSGIILFLSKENHVRYRFSFREIVNKDHWKDSLFFISKGTQVAAEGIIWPLFIFAILGSYFSLGIVGSLLSGISAILVFVVGRYSDHQNKRKIVLFITPFESLAWFLRAFVLTPFHVFAVTIFGALTSGVRGAPVVALEFDKAKGANAGYFVSREVFICLGRVLAIVFVLMTNSLSGGLVLQGFANIAVLIF
jgi:MFS family permease